MRLRTGHLLNLIGILFWLSPRVLACFDGFCLTGCGCRPPAPALESVSCCVPAATPAGSASCDCALAALYAQTAALTPHQQTPPRSVFTCASSPFFSRSVFRSSENRPDDVPTIGKPLNDPSLPLLQQWRC